jgi:hypothetical protein
MSKDETIEDSKDDRRFKKEPLTPEQEEMMEKYKEQIQKLVKEAFKQDK